MKKISKISSSVYRQKEKKNLKEFFQFLHSKTNYIELHQIQQLIYQQQLNYILQLIIAMFSKLKSDDLISILARVKHRLESKQKTKYKRIRKTLDLVEFLMKNGAIEFVAVMIEKFKCYVQPYVYYELNVEYEDLGFASYLISQSNIEKNPKFM